MAQTGHQLKHRTQWLQNGLKRADQGIWPPCENGAEEPQPMERQPSALPGGGPASRFQRRRVSDRPNPKLPGHERRPPKR